MSGVPANADIIAAYLFWETVTTGGDAWETEAVGVKFRDFPIDISNPLSVRRTEQPSDGARCFGSGSLSMHMFMADVLRFLPVKVDSDGKPTGKRLVNDVDLEAQDLDPHTVTLPVRNGNAVPESAGASLVVVYRDPSPNAVTNPLRKIVIYGGNVIKPEVNTAVNLTIKGFYGSATNKSARITHIVSSGQPNDRLQFSFTGAGGTSATISGDPLHIRAGVAAMVGEPDRRRERVDDAERQLQRLRRDRVDLDLPFASQRLVRLCGVRSGRVQHRRRRRGHGRVA